MMSDDDDHGACVDRWLARSAHATSSEQLLQLFEQGFDAVWKRAHRTLGDVTLTAIADRVLHSAAVLYPFFSGLEVVTTGLRWRELRERSKGVPHDQLASAMRFVIVELLTVLGSLTAEILTPALHAELANLPPQRKAPAEPSPSETPSRERNDGEEAKS